MNGSHLNDILLKSNVIHMSNAEYRQIDPIFFGIIYLNFRLNMHNK